MKYTIETRLYKKHNKELIDYFESVVKQYNYVFRIVWHILRNNSKIKQSALNICIQNKFNVNKRTAASIIRSAIGRINLAKGVVNFRLKQYEYKLQSLNKKIDLFQKKLYEQKELAKTNQLKNIYTYRNLKTKVAWMKIRRNRIENNIKSLQNQLNTNKIKILFGTKFLFNSDMKKFLARRDSQIVSIGTKTETCGNANFQLSYNKRNNQFQIKVRKDFDENKQAVGNDRFVYGKCYFSHLKKDLISILKNHNSPLTYRIIKRNGKYYLQCTLTIEKEIFTRKTYGAIGIDFNKGFLAVSETNEHGNLLNIKRLNYRFGQGTKIENDLLQCINQLIKYSLQTGKDLVIENLNFNEKKSKMLKAKSNRGKKYNNMLHSFAYSMFANRCEQVCNRNNVGLIKVNPAWTSWIAKHKYCDLMKLNIHTGASFVIARRGMNIREKKIKK